jgi:hypothetical protein
MRAFLGAAVALLLGLALGWYLWHGGGKHIAGCSPKEVNVLVDSTYTYHLSAYQKLMHLSASANDFVVWTFDQDTTVDSVTAVFGGTSPFASHHFEFADSAAFSGTPTVGADTTVYHYTLTVYPHSGSPVSVDPGIIIDM